MFRNHDGSEKLCYPALSRQLGRYEDSPMTITMVKKQLASGEPCKKCVQAEEMLKQRGLWDKVDNVVFAVEGEPDSAGMKLSERLDVSIAPLFIVERDGAETVFKSVIRFIKAEFPESRAGGKRPSDAGKITPEQLSDLADEYQPKSPNKIIEWALRRYGTDCAIAFSGAEDVVLIDMAAKSGLPFSVFCLDTGRLHPETYRFIDRVREHYGIDIRMMAPLTEPLQAFVRKKGLFSFYEDGHPECCGVRKLEPLKRALAPQRAWVTGQRKDQSPATRGDIDVIGLDESHHNQAGQLIKCNPLANWTSQEVWEYIRDNDVPYNELHDQGFISIGCEPCTRASRPGEHERAARWWWELATQRECGLHSEALQSS